MPGTEIMPTRPARSWDDEWTERVYDMTQEMGRPICGAKMRAGRPCKRPPAVGRARCINHGGAVPRGPDSPHWQGKGYSKDVPDYLAEKLTAVLEDPELTSLAEEIAVLTARAGELLKSLPDEYGPETWANVRAAVSDARLAISRERYGDAEDKIDQALADLDLIRGASDTWGEIYDLAELLRKAKAEERRREDRHEAVMTARQAVSFMANLKRALREEITDDDLLLRIGGRLDRLLNKHRDR